MSTTVRCIRCNKEIPTNEALRSISGFEHCAPCYEEVINPKPSAPNAVRAPITFAPVDSASASTETRVVLVGVNLGVGDWISLLFKFSIASIIVGFVLAIPVFLIMAMVRATSIQ